MGMNVKNIIASTVVTMVVIYLFKKINQKVELPVVGEIIEGV